MKDYVILVDSCCDLGKEFREKHNIEYVKMLLNWTDEKGVEHENIADLDWETLSMKEFYDIIRRGIRFYTSMPSQQDYMDFFDKYLKENKDVLYIACSSGLSNSINIAKKLVETEVKEKYPNNKVIVIDSLRAGMSLGMIIMEAQRLKDEGKDIDEVTKWVEENKLKYLEVGIPETLTYLKRAGRVSGPKALMGNMIGLKPILEFDDKGSNIAVNKAIGRKKAYIKMAEMIKNHIDDPENQEIYLMHADCKDDDVKAFKDEILKAVKVKNIIVEPLGPIIGASSGPGTIIVNYRGK